MSMKNVGINEFAKALKEADNGFITEKGAKEGLIAVRDTIIAELAGGCNVNIPELGTFKLKFRPARKGRNPAIGGEMDIAAKTIVTFTPAAHLKRMVRDLKPEGDGNIPDCLLGQRD